MCCLGPLGVGWGPAGKRRSGGGVFGGVRGRQLGGPRWIYGHGVHSSSFRHGSTSGRTTSAAPAFVVSCQLLVGGCGITPCSCHCLRFIVCLFPLNARGIRYTARRLAHGELGAGAGPVGWIQSPDGCIPPSHLRPPWFPRRYPPDTRSVRHQREAQLGCQGQRGEQITVYLGKR